MLLLELTVADMTCQLYVKDPPTPKTRRKYTLQRCWILIWAKMKRDVIFFLIFNTPYWDNFQFFLAKFRYFLHYINYPKEHVSIRQH